MIVGFTGTRHGLTTAQKDALRSLLLELQPTGLRHGDCIGSDDQAATLYDSLFGNAGLECHPPVDDAHRAYNKRHSVEHPPKMHFARNRDIVMAADVVVACPYGMVHLPTGGTWYTADFAVKKGKTLYVVWPDGRVQKGPI